MEAEADRILQSCDLGPIVSRPPFLIAALLCSRPCAYSGEVIRYRSDLSGTAAEPHLDRGGLSGTPRPITAFLDARPAATYKPRHSFNRGWQARRCDAAAPRRSTRGHAMAGHSQFKNIMHRKGKQDAVRSKLFSKLAREITVAAKIGPARSEHERPAARRHHRRPGREHAQGQYRAGHQEGLGRRQREL